MVSVGFFRSPAEWMEEAGKLSHPVDNGNLLPDLVEQAIKANVCDDPKSLTLRRKLSLMKLKILVAQCAKDESLLKQAMPPWRRQVMQCKNILAWEKFLGQFDYDDMGVVNILKNGVDLVGISECPPCYDLKLKRATCLESEVRDSALLRQALLASPREMEAAMLQSLLEETQAEAKAGYLEGPFATESEVSQALGTSEWGVIRRFVIRQGEKMRPIDDASEASLNAAYTQTIGLQLQDAEFLGAMCVRIMQLSREARPGSPKHDWVGKCLL